MQIPGLVNVDFADVRAIMANAGSSLMGIGTATGMHANCYWGCNTAPESRSSI
jgi:cell division GTPase FtsZ